MYKFLSVAVCRFISPRESRLEPDAHAPDTAHPGLSPMESRGITEDRTTLMDHLRPGEELAQLSL